MNWQISIKVCVLYIHSYTECMWWGHGNGYKWKIHLVVCAIDYISYIEMFYCVIYFNYSHSNGECPREIRKYMRIYCYLTICHYILIFTYNCSSLSNCCLINREYIITLLCYVSQRCYVLSLMA